MLRLLHAVVLSAFAAGSYGADELYVSLGGCVTRFESGEPTASNCGTTFARSSFEANQDANGCFDALRPACLVVVGTESDGERQKTTFRNQCNRRIYARYCHGTESGPPRCGGGGLAPNETIETYASQFDGRVCGLAVGSTRKERDFLCRSRESSWRMCDELLSADTPNMVGVTGVVSQSDNQDIFVTPEIMKEAMRQLDRTGSNSLH